MMWQVYFKIFPTIENRLDIYNKYIALLRTFVICLIIFFYQNHYLLKYTHQVVEYKYRIVHEKWFKNRVSGLTATDKKNYKLRYKVS